MPTIPQEVENDGWFDSLSNFGGLAAGAAGEILSTRENHVAGGIGSNIEVLSERTSAYRYLMFIGEVSDNVSTGKEIIGKGGAPVRVGICDHDGQFIVSGPESSATVEIVCLDSSGEANKHNFSHEDFEDRIINKSDKTKPHFAKNYLVVLEKGMCELRNAKLAHGASYMKNCWCRLGARVVGNFSGIKVQEAWTGPFMVSDSRNKLYGKHYPPSVSDSVWRLEKIGRNGLRCERLNENKVYTVGDFLFLHSVDPRRIQEIIGDRNPAWKDTLAHAQTCKIDVDKRICVYNDSSECNMSMVFDVVEGLKGVIKDSQYFPINHLTEAEKVRARELLRSAFENRDRIAFPKTTLMHQLPYQANFAAMSTPIQENLPGCSLTFPKNMNQRDPTEPGTTSQGISPSVVRSLGNAHNISDSNCLGLSTMGQWDHLSSDYSHNTSWFLGDSGCSQNLMPLISEAEALCFQQSDSTIITGMNHYNPTEPGNSAQSISPYIGPSGNANDYSHLNSPGSTWEQANFDDLIHSPGHHLDFQDCAGNGLSETPGDEPQSRHQGNALYNLFVKAVDFIWGIFRGKKRVRTLEQKDMHAAKRQRI